MRQALSHRLLAIVALLFLASLACRINGTERVASTPVPVPDSHPEVILQRLEVVYLGQDGHKVIGSGCPGSDGQGQIIDLHFALSGVDVSRNVDHIVVAGDNSTLTWEYPCHYAWELRANDLGMGRWEIFIAPSLPSRIYTILFFYDDNTLALGMTTAR